MAESGGTEKQLLGQFVEKQTKYGTTTRLVSKSSTFIKHFIQKTDTLMGIALKYSVTVEQIKRENKLWTNDSLFLREHLLIPVAHQDISKIPEDCEVITIEKSRSRSETGNSDQRSRTSSQNSVNSLHSEKQKENDKCDSEQSVVKQEPSGMDFFSKFDNSIAEIKSNVKKMEENARFITDSADSDPLVLPPRKNSRSSNKRTYSLPSPTPDSTPSHNSNHSSRRSTQDFTHISDQSSPVLLIKSRNSSQKVQTSLERLEKASDELFQL
ncbi:hypothetical protein FSP39_020378 [Pinctada imbricata]|uniref:LysM domain-containing protein n=1 Tax=Pinctada imbricata TaxID=66713 RepID=A0AA88Y116_PINIB|nr:hypothetical protein FSP39_020378 [Pinctada imbricata]